MMWKLVLAHGDLLTANVILQPHVEMAPACFFEMVSFVDYE